MKKIKYLFLLPVLALLGCSDLEEEPIGLLSPGGFFNAPRDVQTVVNGAIGNIGTEAFWGRKLALPLMLRSDMVGIGDQGTAQRRIDHDNFTMSDDNGMVSAFWPRAYQIISAVNEGIAGAENIDAPEQRLNPVTAQARFIRAFCYYHLVRLFGDIPYLDKPIVDPSQSTDIGKTDAAEVYAKIIEDLEYAKTWLPNTQPSRSTPSKATAAAYLASAYLTLGEFQKAYDEAKFIIDNEGTFNLGLAPDFQDLFDANKVDATNELLFALDFNGFRDGNYGQDYHPALTGIRANEFGNIGGGWSVAVPSARVYETWDGRDYRKAVSLDTIGVFEGVVEPFSKFPEFDSRNIQSAYIAKYSRFPGQTSNGNGRGSSHNYALMRYAEVLLIAAEALNEISPASAEAVGYLNRVRERARNGNATGFPQDVTAGVSQDEFRNLVLEERKWELAFEFKRWYDIARRQLGNQVFNSTGLEERPNFDPSRDYLLPLPADELQRNPNLQPNNQGY